MEWLALSNKALGYYYLTHCISNVLHDNWPKIEAPVFMIEIIFACEHGVRGNLTLIGEILTY